MWSMVASLPLLIVSIVNCVVADTLPWEELHHKNAFSEILSNRNVEPSWRYDFMDMGMEYSIGGQRYANNSSVYPVRSKRFADSTFRGRPKSRQERWHQNFNMNSTNLDVDQGSSLVTLLIKIVERYMASCIPIILYDKTIEESDGNILQSFFQQSELSFLLGKIDSNYRVVNPSLLHPYDKSCRSYILFLSDVTRAHDVLGPQTSNRVIIVPRSTQWKLQEFLSSKLSSDIINLLVIGESLTTNFASTLSTDTDKERPYVLYTHRLYTDGLGSNVPIVLTSWIKGKLSRPHVNLFPLKFQKGFSGHRFLVTAIHQPPYVIKKLSTDGVGNINIAWDGLEIRLLRLIGQRLNFSYEILEPKLGNELGPTYGIMDLVQSRRADIGLAGAYVSNERVERVDMSNQHSRDCAAFITLASKALPRYRAIMGPFQWPVWLAIIATYLLAIFPLAFSDRLTLRHLIGNYGEIENMFWYVFGTFTNSLTFHGQFSWSKSKKTSTRMLIGWYWVFSIIITACYTSSIIAFVTLPVFPDTVDSINDLLSGFFRIGTFAKDGWQYWFSNSSHPLTRKLLKDLELVANVEEGLGNVTKSFFWSYAFLASRVQLEYIVQNNFTDEAVSKRSALHISEECLAIFGISMMFPKDSVYTDRLNEFILRLLSSGLIQKINMEMSWDLQRSGTGKLLQSNAFKRFKISEVEERKLNLADTEGMFLLMGVGYIIAGSVLVSEIVGGCAQRCRQFARRNSTITSIKSSFHPNTSAQPSAGTNASGQILSRPLSRKSSVFMRFRRKTDPSQTISEDAAVAVARHRRHNSLVSAFGRKSSTGSAEHILDMNQSGYSESTNDDGSPSRMADYDDVTTVSPVDIVEIHQPHSEQDNGLPSFYNETITEELLEDNFGEKVTKEVY